MLPWTAFRGGELCGVLSEKQYKLGIRHSAYAPSNVLAADIMRPSLMIASSQMPLVDAIHDLFVSGARHLVVVDQSTYMDTAKRHTTKPAAPTAGGAFALLNANSVPPGRARAVLSVRDLVRHLLRIHGDATKRLRSLTEARTTILRRSGSSDLESASSSTTTMTTSASSSAGRAVAASSDDERVSSGVSLENPNRVSALLRMWDRLVDRETQLDNEAFGRKVRSREC